MCLRFTYARLTHTHTNTHSFVCLYLTHSSLSGSWFVVVQFAAHIGSAEMVKTLLLYYHVNSRDHVGRYDELELLHLL